MRTKCTSKSAATGFSCSGSVTVSLYAASPCFTKVNVTSASSSVQEPTSAGSNSRSVSAYSGWRHGTSGLPVSSHEQRNIARYTATNVIQTLMTPSVAGIQFQQDAFGVLYNGIASFSAGNFTCRLNFSNRRRIYGLCFLREGNEMRRPAYHVAATMNAIPEMTRKMGQPARSL